jgi:hypothetical protein
MYHLLVSNLVRVCIKQSDNNSIEKNNFILNQRQTLFEDYTNIWDQNYWNRPQVLPKLIFGRRFYQNKLLITCLNIDRDPAMMPYSID